MFGVGPIELMVILVLALIVFGPEKLPEMMRSAGHAIREFQRYSSELTSTFQETQAEFSSALDVSEVTDAVNEAVESVTVNGTYEPAPAAPAYVEPEPVRVVQSYSEYDTAAAMVEPIAPFVEPEPIAQAGAAPEQVSESPAKPRRARKKPVSVAEAPPEPAAEPV